MRFMPKVTPLPDINIEIPPKTNIAWEACDRRVGEGKGDHIFLYYQDRQFTYRQIQSRQNQIGNALKNLGVAPGDHVLCRAANSPQFFSSLLATLKIGAVAVPSQTLFRERELAHIINNSDAVVAFADVELVGTIEAVKSNCPTLKHIIVFGEAQGDQIAFDNFVKGASDKLECHDTSADDEAVILYTSGTTGLPKGVVRAHRDTYACGIPQSRFSALVPEDIFMHPQELTFGYTIANLYAVIYTGARMVLYPGRTTPENVLEHVQRYRVTKLAGVPALFRMILAIKDCEKQYDLSSLKYLVSAGEPLPPDVYHELKDRLGVECFDHLGQTECPPVCGQRPSFPVKPGSMGKPFAQLPVAIIDDNAQLCPSDRIGHLVIKDGCPTLFLGYRKMPEKWAEVHKYTGWYDTGDLAYIDAEGYFFHCGRADDMIKSRGYLVSPREVEETIAEMSDVFEVAVVGIPDAVAGKRVKAFVLLKPGVTPNQSVAEQIREHVNSRIAPYKVPKDIEFVTELPRNPMGKILRRELRRLEEERFKKDEPAGFRF